MQILTRFFLRHQNIMLVNLTTNPFKTLVLARLQVPRDNTRSSQILNAGSSFPCKCKTTLFILKEMPLTFAVESFHGIKMFHETVAAPLTCVSFFSCCLVERGRRSGPLAALWVRVQCKSFPTDIPVAGDRNPHSNLQREILSICS